MYSTFHKSRRQLFYLLFVCSVVFSPLLCFFLAFFCAFFIPKIKKALEGFYLDSFSL